MALTTPLQRWSAPFQPGAIDSDGLEKLLGASDHDALSLLVRETIQNSWDASRDHEGGPVSSRTPEYLLHLRSLTEHQHRDLKSMLEDGAGPGMERLADLLAADEVQVLEVVDRHTSGLGGPIDSTLALEDGVVSDFVDLVFAIGAPQNTELGGGTFGFGKVATYTLSAVRTVVIISRPLENGKPGDLRLIASAFGPGYSHERRRFTGRHWWGSVGENTVLPVVGNRAERIAAAISNHVPAPDETGTTLVVLDPDLGRLPRHDDDESGLSGDEAVERMISAILWSAWPKLVAGPGDDEEPIRVRVLHNGQARDIPDPNTTHPFIGFSHALATVRDAQETTHEPSDRPLTRESGSQTEVVRSALKVMRTRRPTATVGVAAVTETVQLPRTPRWLGDPLVAESMGVTGRPHHLAMMRQAELVVTYLEGPEHPDGNSELSWGGVFRTDASVDRAFARAEPPAHDRWVHGGLDRPDKTYVRRGAELGPKDLFSALFAGESHSAAGTGGGLAALVRAFLGGLTQEGEAPKRTEISRTGTSTRARVRIINTELDRLDDGTDVVMANLEVAEKATLRVTGAVKLAGGGTDPDVLVQTLGFGGPDDNVPKVANDVIRAEPGPLRVWVTQPADCSVVLRAEVV